MACSKRDITDVGDVVEGDEGAEKSDEVRKVEYEHKRQRVG